MKHYYLHAKTVGDLTRIFCALFQLGDIVFGFVPLVMGGSITLYVLGLLAMPESFRSLRRRLSLGPLLWSRRSPSCSWSTGCRSGTRTRGPSRG